MPMSASHSTTMSPTSHVKIKIPGSNVDLDYTLIIDRTPTSSQPAVTPQEALFLPRSDESKQIVELINDYARGGIVMESIINLLIILLKLQSKYREQIQPGMAKIF